MRVFSEVITQWSELTDTASGLVVAPREAVMNTNIMQLYAHGDASLSIRFNDSNQMKTIDQKINKIIPSKKYRHLLDFQIEGGIRRPPMEPTEHSASLIRTIFNIANKLDIRLIEEHRWSSADICFLDDRIPSVDGMGPLGSRQHNEQEFILHHSLLERAALLAMVLYELGRGEI